MMPGPPFRTCSARSLLAAVLLVLQLLPDASGKLLMAYYMHRHGARNVLPKSSLLSESNATGGPALLAVGHRQLQAAGSAFRERYLDPSNCTKTITCLGDMDSQYGVLGRSGVGYHNYNTLIRSSGLDRTINSADAFTTGLFPHPANESQADLIQAVPVYTTPDRDDWFIRAYTKCPTYNRRLQQWYATPEFTAKEAESAELRNKVAALNPQMNVSLPTFWNVFDVYNTFQTYGFGGPLQRLDEPSFQQLLDLANWLEAKKMEQRFTANLLGGSILADLLRYMDVAAKAPPQAMYYKLLGLSAHYNTLMVTPAALNVDLASYLWAKKIPAMGAVLVYELHQDDKGAAAVRLVAQDGPDSNYTTVPLPCAKADSAAEAQLGAGSCSYADFVSLVQPLALGTPAAWCSACANNDTTACQLHWTQQQAGNLQAKAAAEAGAAGDGLSRTAIVIISVLAAVAGVLLAAVIALVVMLRAKSKQAAARPGYMYEPPPPTVSSPILAQAGGV